MKKYIGGEAVIEEHKKMQKLVEARVIVPGIFREENGVKVYEPISTEEYIKMIENGNIEDIAYNTYSMGRGIFTLGKNGEIINYKGVDSRLEDADNIAVGKVNANIYNISEMLGYVKSPYQIVVMSVPGHKSEIRVRGASQLQNLINEKQKQEETRIKDKDGLIKFPELRKITVFSNEFCKRVGLPQGQEITSEYLEQLIEDDRISRDRTGGTFGNYAYTCLKYMKENGITIDMRNQTWEEYFSNFSTEDYEKIKNIPNLELAIRKQDKEYQLGAMFGQTTRILENPFRIMDLEYFVDNQKQDQVQAILDYTSSIQNQDYITYYAETMAKNLAGFMNLNMSYNNWAHRQDFALSAEMCDDAYDDISQTLEIANNIKKGDEHYNDINSSISRYYNQIYLFASNMKVIENAYKMTGRPIPEDYQDIFINTFIEKLQNKDEILKKLAEESEKDFNDILMSAGGHSAIKNFEGKEEYVSIFRNKVRAKCFEQLKKVQFSEQEIGKGTIDTPTIKKDNAQNREKQDEQELHKIQEGIDGLEQ